jgi:hypothetical protein
MMGKNGAKKQDYWGEIVLEKPIAHRLTVSCNLILFIMVMNDISHFVSFITIPTLQLTLVQTEMTPLNFINFLEILI